MRRQQVEHGVATSNDARSISAAMCWSTSGMSNLVWEARASLFNAEIL